MITDPTPCPVCSAPTIEAGRKGRSSILLDAEPVSAFAVYATREDADGKAEVVLTREIAGLRLAHTCGLRRGRST